MRTVLERYEDDLMGLPYPVTLLNVAEQVTNPDGSVIGVGVPNAERIAATVAMALCFLPQRLIGAEVRFHPPRARQKQPGTGRDRRS